MKGSEGSLSISQSSIPETLKQIFDELKREAYSITADLYNHSWAVPSTNSDSHLRPNKIMLLPLIVYIVIYKNKCF